MTRIPMNMQLFYIDLHAVFGGSGFGMFWHPERLWWISEEEFGARLAEFDLFDMSKLSPDWVPVQIGFGNAKCSSKRCIDLHWLHSKSFKLASFEQFCMFSHKNHTLYIWEVPFYFSRAIFSCTLLVWVLSITCSFHKAVSPSSSRLLLCFLL